jgi:transketolase
LKHHQRDVFGQCLVEIGESVDELVVIDADNSTATRTDGFARRFPERFFNVGVAEQNLIGVAAGLALAGMRPLACTFSMFLTGRGFEAIRNTIGLNHLGVTLVGTHAGISVGKDGSTHFAIEDIALMRSMPGMQVVVPADHVQIRELLRQLILQSSPSYLRISRWSMPAVTSRNEDVVVGRGILLRDGEDCVVIATGLMVHPALVAADRLATKGISCAVACLHTLKPLDLPFLVNLATRFEVLVTAEEHNIVGGLHGAVSEVLSQFKPRRCIPVGVRDHFASGGEESQLFEAFGLSSQAIAEAALSVIEPHR